jgi:hypothetical protein
MRFEDYMSSFTTSSLGMYFEWVRRGHTWVLTNLRVSYRSPDILQQVLRCMRNFSFTRTVPSLSSPHTQPQRKICCIYAKGCVNLFSWKVYSRELRRKNSFPGCVHNRHKTVVCLHEFGQHVSVGHHSGTQAGDVSVSNFTHISYSIQTFTLIMARIIIILLPRKQLAYTS